MELKSQLHFRWQCCLSSSQGTDLSTEWGAETPGGKQSLSWVNNMTGGFLGGGGAHL